MASGLSIPVATSKGNADPTPGPATDPGSRGDHAMSSTTARDEAIAKLGSLIKDIRVAMLTTADPDGNLHSRPMATQTTDFDGILWFFTRADAPKVGEIDREHRVNVSYADAHKQHYVSVSGQARLVRDPAKNKELWNPLYKAWFPDGLDDPALALLRVDVERAEYWDSPSSKVVLLVGSVKALATGKTYKPGDHEKVKIR
jgi:general stress protein 26